MSLEQLPEELASSIEDAHSERTVSSHRRVWTGRVFALDEDEVRVTSAGGPVLRQYLAHPGAVGIVAVRGAAGAEQILLERQYRHPARAELWEIPAGLLDVEGEDPLDAAKRELREEADLEAARWDVLVDYFTSPGGSSESIRVFLARDLSETETPFERLDEEADFVQAWVALDEAVSAVLAGRLHNPSTVSGVLAAAAARGRDWATLRATDSAWLR